MWQLAEGRGTRYARRRGIRLGFLDEIRAALRNPPGLYDGVAVPEALFEQCRRAIFDELLLRPESPTFDRDHQKWSHPVELRTRVRQAWRTLSEGLLGVTDETTRISLVLSALRRQLRSGDPDSPLAFTGNLPTGLQSREIERLVKLFSEESAGSVGWRDPAQYLAELGALDLMGTRRTRLGELYLSFGPRELVIALLHAEASQSTGADDEFRLPRWVFSALGRDHPLIDERDPTPWPPLGCLIAFGLLDLDSNHELSYVSDRVPWLADAANEQSPLAILVRSALEDQAQGVFAEHGAPPRPSAQGAVRDIAELVAHELGNALSPLAITVSQVGRELGSENRHVVRLEQLTSRLQQFARSIDQLLPSEEPMTSIGLIDVLQDALARTATERNGHLALRLHVTDAQIRGRRSRLRLAFENLIRNTAQAAIRIDRPVTLSLLGETRGQQVEIVFEDDGPGVSVELADTLFDRGSSGRGSSGLGLALVREIAREHRGDVRYERTEQGGARFVLTLPRE